MAENIIQQAKFVVDVSSGGLCEETDIASIVAG